ncbi:hypothetical protein WMY93_031944 [Mugilogobius chulae]|uniref:Ig-like domain-containing protein n=1 Tax=Mugilogobius chulae TaxID=88201 RepID=A0AAW0MDD9_9GOBI
MSIQRRSLGKTLRAAAYLMTMMRDNETHEIPAQTSPGLTRSASGVGEPEHLDEKWATGTKRKWLRCENMALLECYYSSNPSQRGYMRRMWSEWLARNPHSRLTAKQLVAQCSNIHKRQLLSQIEIDEGNNSRADPPGLETEQYWKSIWEREASHNSDAQWLMDLRKDHSNLPEQNPVTTTVADIQERVSGLNPLSQIINKTGYGYRLRNGATISHLLYMDGIKLYAKSERDIDLLIHTTRIYSSDIGMSFGLEKCSRMVTKRGKHPETVRSRKEGGRGLVSMRVTIQDETSKIHKYIKDKAPTDGVLSECLRQWGTDEVLEEEPSWEDKPLHGMYHRNITEVADLKKSYQWLERAGLKDSTEALILAAQEQALSTRAIEAQIYHTRQDPRCRSRLMVIVLQLAPVRAIIWVEDCPVSWQTPIRILRLSAEYVTVTVQEGENAELPCFISENTEKILLIWTQTDLNKDLLVYRRGRLIEDDADPQFRGRVHLKDPSLKNGDMSVILSKVTSEDSGIYTCEVFEEEQWHTQSIRLITGKKRDSTQDSSGTTDNTADDRDTTTLGTGAIIGLVLGLVVVIALISLACIWSKNTQKIPLLKCPGIALTLQTFHSL